MCNKEADAVPGEGGGDHSRGQAAFLTGVHAKKTQGADVRAVTDAEVNPTDPPIPAAELAGELFAGWTRERRHVWLATLEGRPAGEVTARVEDGDDNRHRADVEWLAVDPAFRRRGAGDPDRS